MKQLDTGKDKIKKICEILKEETLDPAKEKAGEILKTAEEKSHAIIAEAHNQADSILKEAYQKIEKERELFEASLKQAAAQSVSVLKQEVEQKLFDEAMATWVEQQSVDPKLAAKLVDALVQALEKEGTAVNLSGYVGKALSTDAVNAALGAKILEKLKEGGVILGEFGGGVQVKLHDRRIILDLSSGALAELLARYVRKDFRKLLFK